MQEIDRIIFFKKNHEVLFKRALANVIIKKGCDISKGKQKKNHDKLIE